MTEVEVQLGGYGGAGDTRRLETWVEQQVRARSSPLPGACVLLLAFPGTWQSCHLFPL